MTRENEKRTPTEIGARSESDHHVDTKRKRITMTWVKFDDGWYDRPETRKLSYAARVAFIGSLSYSARHLTDGLVPEDVAETLVRIKDYEAAAAELFEQGHWTRTDDGQIFIPDWAAYLRESDKVLEDRQRGAERQARLRDRRSGSNTTSGRNGVSNGVTNGVSNTAPSRPDPKGGRDVPSSAALRGTSPTDHEPNGPEEEEPELAYKDYPLAVRIKHGLELSKSEAEQLTQDDRYDTWYRMHDERPRALVELQDIRDGAGRASRSMSVRDWEESGRDKYWAVHKPTYDALQWADVEPCDLLYDAAALGYRELAAQWIERYGCCFDPKTATNPIS